MEVQLIRTSKRLRFKDMFSDENFRFRYSLLTISVLENHEKLSNNHEHWLNSNNYEKPTG